MTQAELNRKVARATGESVRTIAARGFSLLNPSPEEREPQVVDWDEIQAERHVEMFPPRRHDQVA